MSACLNTAGQCDSFLLSRLPDQDYQALAPRLELVSLSFKQVIYERGMPIQYVYFPCSCVLSVLAFMRDGAAIEIATIGNEGFSGIDLLMGSAVASDTVICQLAGNSLRMRTCDFREMINGGTPLHKLARHFLHAYVRQMAQSVACNRLHSVEQRFARWLLITHDRARGESFYLTQEFMANMLGVHRPSVSVVANAYQRAGAIRYVRGHMSILNRAALESASCECYQAVAGQFDRLLGIRRG